MQKWRRVLAWGIGGMLAYASVFALLFFVVPAIFLKDEPTHLSLVIVAVLFRGVTVGPDVLGQALSLAGITGDTSLVSICLFGFLLGVIAYFAKGYLAWLTNTASVISPQAEAMHSLRAPIWIGTAIVFVLLGAGVWYGSYLSSKFSEADAGASSTAPVDTNLSHHLVFDVPFEALKVSAPDVYAEHAGKTGPLSAALYDVDGDGRLELFVYDGSPESKWSLSQPVYVYGNESPGVWSSVVQDNGPLTIESRLGPGSISVERSPWGDIALATNDGRNFFDWLNGKFENHGAGWDRAKWLSVKEGEYLERISPSLFREEVVGDSRKITSDQYRISFEMPSSWDIKGKEIHKMISVAPPNEDGLGASGMTINYSTDGYEGSWGHGRTLSSSVNGTQESFETLRAQPDGYATGEKTNRYQKIGSFSVDGYPAVRVQYSGYIPGSDGFWNNDITWIKNGNTNWYINVSDFSGGRYGAQFERILASFRVF